MHPDVVHAGDPRPPWIRRVHQTPLRIVAATAASYAVLAQLTYLVGRHNDVGVVSRPAAGVALAAALLVPSRRWGWVAVGLAVAQFSVIVVNTGDVVVGLTASAVVCLAAFSGAWLTRRLGNPHGDLVPARRLLAFFAGGVVAGPIIAAIPGLLVLQLAGADVLSRTTHLILSEMLGALIVAPLVLAPAGKVRRSWIERGAMYGSFVGACALIMFGHDHGWGATLPYLLLPLLTWAAFRFGSRTVANCGAILYLVGNASVLSANSPFNAGTGSSFEEAVALRVFVVVAIAGGLFLAAVVEDLVGVRAMQSELRRAALTDHLTGLPNRVRLEQLLRDSSGDGVTLLLCDVDHFKRVNDGYGHHAGDRLLVAVADRLQQGLRDGDHLVRLGGDEFVVLVPTVDPVAVDAVASRMEHAVAQPFYVSDRVSVRPTISIGVAGTDTSPSGDLLRHADVALYAAKSAGRHQARRFDMALRSQVEAQTRIEREIGDALASGHLGCVFQPEVVLGTRQLFAVEALVRWRHPTRGVIPPDEFVPVMEQLGLADELFHTVLRDSLAWQQRWEQRCGVRPSVSLNLAPHQLCNTQLIGPLVDAVRSAGSHPSQLCLEVTEGTDMQGGAGAVLSELSELGFLLAIDDFGTGWASMGRLAAYPWDLLKVDRSFVAGMGSIAEDDAIVASAIALAHSLGIQAVAEGVETDEQIRRLRALGCDIVQGYRLGAPMAGEDVGERIGARSTWIPSGTAEHASDALQPVAD